MSTPKLSTVEFKRGHTPRTFKVKRHLLSAKACQEVAAARVTAWRNAIAYPHGVGVAGLGSGQGNEKTHGHAMAGQGEGTQRLRFLWCASGRGVGRGFARIATLSPRSFYAFATLWLWSGEGLAEGGVTAWTATSAVLCRPLPSFLPSLKPAYKATQPKKDGKNGKSFRLNSPHTYMRKADLEIARSFRQYFCRFCRP